MGKLTDEVEFQEYKEKRMRKRVSILLMLLAALVLLSVSCNGEASLLNEEELVSVCFSEPSSRALSASLESFAGNMDTNYYWAYEAKKIDSSELRRGETATYDAFNAGSANWVRLDENGDPAVGITGTEIAGFSQGTWKFMLYACVRTGSGTYKLVYKGENPSVLLKNSGSNPGAGPNVVSVSVSPLKTDGEKGTLAISVSSIVEHSTNYTGKIDTVEAGYVVGLPGSEAFPFSVVTEDLEVSLEPGTYTVKVKFNLKDSSSVTSTVVVTVYSNLTTTIDGSIDGVI